MEFVAPDWNAPLDVEAAVALCPETAIIKGFLSQALVDAAAQDGTARGPYVAFSDYSLREHMRLLVESARSRFPDAPLRIGLRRFGRATRGERAAEGHASVGREQQGTPSRRCRPSPAPTKS